jgi:hypothetical protein
VRPKDFDLVRYWTLSSRAYEVGLYRATATVRVSRLGMAKFDLLGSAVAQSAAQTAGSADADGWVTLAIPIESIDQAAADLMSLGTDAEVLEPLELRRRIAETAHELSRLYASGEAQAPMIPKKNRHFRPQPPGPAKGRPEDRLRGEPEPVSR